MGRPRISIRGLMASVLAVGLGVAALRHASGFWAGVVLVVTLGLLTAAILGGAHRAGGGRAGWMGFALFGWGYAALGLAPWSLPTGFLLDRLYARLSPSRVVAMDPFAASGGLEQGEFLVLDPDPPAGSLPAVSNPSDAVFAVGTLDVRSFRTIGQCLFALLAGLIGAAIARRYYASAGGRRAPTARTGPADGTAST